VQNTAVECQIHEILDLQMLVVRRVHDETVEIQIVLHVVADEARMGFEEQLQQPAVLIDLVQGIL
jgi:hypothetical protein